MSLALTGQLAASDDAADANAAHCHAAPFQV